MDGYLKILLGLFHSPDGRTKEQTSQKLGFPVKFSDASKLVYDVNSKDEALIAFEMMDFIEIDLNKFLQTLLESIANRFPYKYNGIQLQIVLSDMKVYDQAMKDYIDSVNSFFVKLNVNAIKYIESKDIIRLFLPEGNGVPDLSVYEQFVDDADDEEEYIPVKKSKCHKKINYDDEKCNLFASKVFNSYTEKKVNEIYGKFGRLVSADKEAIKHDTELIEEFLDDFINSRSKTAKKMKKNLLTLWINSFVRYVEI